MTDFILPFNWDVKEVWKLEAPVEEVPIGRVMFLLEHPFWSRKPGSYLDFDLCPGEVLRSAAISPEHRARIDKAETQWPLDFIDDGNRLWVVDGIHRLAKLHEQRAKSVRIRRHPMTVRRIIETVEKECSAKQRIPA